MSKITSSRLWQPRKPIWVRTEATKYAWYRDAAWRADALKNGGDAEERIRLLYAATEIYRQANQQAGS